MYASVRVCTFPVLQLVQIEEGLDGAQHGWRHPDQVGGVGGPSAHWPAPQALAVAAFVLYLRRNARAPVRHRFSAVLGVPGDPTTPAATQQPVSHAKHNVHMHAR